jgi:hypothetical protein
MYAFSKCVIMCDFTYAISLAIIHVYLFQTIKHVISDLKCMCDFCVK